jgi:hypothetical protein
MNHRRHRGHRGQTERMDEGYWRYCRLLRVCRHGEPYRGRSPAHEVEDVGQAALKEDRDAVVEAITRDDAIAWFAYAGDVPRKRCTWARS